MHASLFPCATIERIRGVEVISHSNKHIGSIYGNGSSWKQMGPRAAAVGTGIYLAAALCRGPAPSTKQMEGADPLCNF